MDTTNVVGGGVTAGGLAITAAGIAVGGKEVGQAVYYGTPIGKRIDTAAFLFNYPQSALDTPDTNTLSGIADALRKPHPIHARRAAFDAKEAAYFASLKPSFGRGEYGMITAAVGAAIMIGGIVTLGVHNSN